MCSSYTQLKLLLYFITRFNFINTGLSRRKRAAKDSFKRKVLKVLQECFRDRPDPTVLPVSSTTTHPPVGGKQSID